jgi:Glycosyltransferase
MNIAVNTQLLIKDHLEGLGWFEYETLKRITVQHPEHNFLFIFGKPYDKSFIFSDNVRAITVPIPYNHPVFWYYHFEHRIPGILKKNKIDLFLSPDGISSLNTKTKTVFVIHDLNFEHYPKNLSFFYRHYYRYYSPRWAAKAQRIATVSEYSKADIVARYGINPQKIDVVYSAAKEAFKPVGNDIKKITRDTYALGNQYFVFVGAMILRKNLINLFKAFDLFKKNNSGNVKLLIVGAKRWWSKKIRQSYECMEYKDDVIFTGRVSVEILNQLIGSALALTYVSYFEGFGVPILEGMKCETPVITSNSTSLPEIAGDAALSVDAFSIESIAEALEKLYKDNDLRQQLILKGNIRKNEYTWQITADKLWDCIEKSF